MYCLGFIYLYFFSSTVTEYKINGKTIKYNKAQIEPNGLGDVDGNGKVDSTDERLLQGHLAGQINLSSDQRSRADVNQDGQITIEDAQELHMFLESNGGQEGDELSSIAVTKAPNKTTYIEGQNFDKTGMVVQATYASGNKQNIDNYTVTDGTNLKKEQNHVTISYENKTTTQAITVSAKTVTKIEVSKNPNKMEYIQNVDSLDLTGGEITATYSDGSTSKVSMTDNSVKVTGFDNKTVGKNTVTLEYQSKTTSFDVTIVANQNPPSLPVTKIEVSVTPSKTEYVQNTDSLDLSGGEITVTYSDGTTGKIPMTDSLVKVSGFDNRTVGKNTITVEYQSKTTTFDITIVASENPPSVSVTKIEVSKNPNKTEYVQNTDSLDLSGGEITVTYDDGSTKKISMTDNLVKASGFNNQNIGKNTITIEYQSKTTSFDVTIIEKSTPVNPPSQNNTIPGTEGNTTVIKTDPLDAKSDKIAPGILPNTGFGRVCMVSIFIVILAGTISYIKYKKTY